ncbi:MAG: phospholipase D-like domain-containing protein [Gemmataceae bacterium]
MAGNLAKVAKKHASSSRGLTRVFWMLVCAVTAIYPAFQFEPVRQIGGKVVAAVVRKLQGNNPPSATASADSGAVQVYFTQPGRSASESCEIVSAVVRHIDATKTTLDVCAFELDNRVICDALVRAAKRGVRVRLATETNYLEESGVNMLKAVGVPVVDDARPGALMHNKFMVFDNQAVWTGSMNFTENCAYRNNNNGLYIANPDLAANYATKFNWMFEQHKFGGLPSRSARIPNPTVTLADNTLVENYFAPHDHCANHVIDAISKARKSIRFLAFSFTHNGIGNAMLQQAKSGVEVKGVFERTQASSRTEYRSSHARAAGEAVSVYLDANPRNMHHKVIVIDEATTVVGSFNFSENADKSNDENLLIIHNPAVAKRFEEEFRRVYDEAEHAEGAPNAYELR